MDMKRGRETEERGRGRKRERGREREREKEKRKRAREKRVIMKEPNFATRTHLDPFKWCTSLQYGLTKVTHSLLIGNWCCHSNQLTTGVENREQLKSSLKSIFGSLEYTYSGKG